MPRRGGDRVAAGEYFSEDKMRTKIPERVFWLNFSQHQAGPQVQPVLRAGPLTEDASLSGQWGTCRPWSTIAIDDSGIEHHMPVTSQLWDKSG